ncbi:hypothetical protein EXIGLDRAFT_697055 [Exidia glandulosa HHB12029]|uniref:RNA polymerase III RPC4-domain-containing protein n=1 Tax=Exidia glandulosa HHB12029 TaxID=1314781 RepID=A0A165MYS9_EXIGL|nr:hypothetical protein EXIGLDRAFT_697055 [Exidia glandulosa HHB12029]
MFLDLMPLACQEPASAPPPPKPGRGRGRGRGGGPGGGDRPPPPRQEDTMVASGPFAMGPALGTGRRAAPRTVFAASAPQAGSSSLSGAPPPPVLKKERTVKLEDDEDEAEQYSDPDNGVEIVDIADVRRMDYMAPETLRKERKNKPKVKVEIDESELKLFEDPAGPSIPVVPEGEFVLADVDDSDELRELVRAVTGKQDDMEIVSLSQELFIFQFPRPFPTFQPSTPAPVDAMDVDRPSSPSAAKPAIKSDKAKGKEKAPDPARHVSFADEVKPLVEDEDGVKKEVKKTPLDGLIGQLEVYDDGSIKMRLGDGILMNVSAATPASYLQQAAHIDRDKKSMVVLGEVRQRYNLSPDLDGLLDELDREEALEAIKDQERAMDTS